MHHTVVASLLSYRLVKLKSSAISTQTVAPVALKFSSGHCTSHPMRGFTYYMPSSDHFNQEQFVFSPLQALADIHISGFLTIYINLRRMVKLMTDYKSQLSVISMMHMPKVVVHLNSFIVEKVTNTQKLLWSK